MAVTASCADNANNHLEMTLPPVRIWRLAGARRLQCACVHRHAHRERGRPTKSRGIEEQWDRKPGVSHPGKAANMLCLSWTHTPRGCHTAADLKNAVFGSHEPSLTEGYNGGAVAPSRRLQPQQRVLQCRPDVGEPEMRGVLVGPPSAPLIPGASLSRGTGNSNKYAE
jgi:hypothetical protein